MRLNIKHNRRPLDRKVCDRAQRIILALPRKAATGTWPDFGYQQSLAERFKREKPEVDTMDSFATVLPNEQGSQLLVLLLDPDPSQFKLLSMLGKWAKSLQYKREDIILDTRALSEPLAQRLAQALVLTLGAGLETLPDFRKQAKTIPQQITLHIHSNSKPETKRALIEATGNGLARYLTLLPGNHLTPRLYVKRIRDLAKAEGWSMTYLDLAALKKKKAGAFIAVAQGNSGDAGGIVHLRYAPAGKSRGQTVALVGKGICFDSGGMNLKPSRYMHGMHQDMAGSAVALGCLLSLSRLKVNFAVDCWLAITENHIGARAYKQNDVVTAANGTTIEIVHTDAEGRMVLADTLTLAAKSKPALMIDYATLTGSCIGALGTAYSGIFGNHPGLLETAVRAGQASGERVWAFPHDLDFDADLQSDIADIKQCTLEGGPDHILAARFLDRFVPGTTPWLHVDLAAAANKGGLGHVTSDTTGFGVHLTLNLLLDQRILGSLN